MNDIRIFESPEFGQVRTTMIDGEPWFAGKDVASVLGYANPQKAIRDHVDVEDRTVNDSFTVNGTPLSLINESGLYSLVLRSDKPEAKAFKRWITHEVLPSIRKHGMYAIDDLIANPEMAIAAFQALKQEREARQKLETENRVQAQLIAEMQPKVTYHDTILQNPGVVKTTFIAKDYGMSARKLNAILAAKGVQYKQGGVWFLYQDYADQGYTHSKTTLLNNGNWVMDTRWTQKGRLFLYELLKRCGILPLIEQ